jgi:hypothetical protein
MAVAGGFSRSLLFFVWDVVECDVSLKKSVVTKRD